MTHEAPDLLAPDYEFEERAAIMEFEGGLPREEAEREAAKIVAEAQTILSSASTTLGKEPLTQSSQRNSSNNEPLHIPSEVFQNLPEPLAGLCSYFSEGHERDVFLTGALTVCSGILSRVLFAHRDKSYHVNLFALVTAPAGSGKGDADLARRLGAEIDKRLFEESKAEIAKWEHLKKEIEDMERRNSRRRKSEMPETVPELPPCPPLRTLFIAVNASARAFVDRLHSNGGEGALFDTETATLLTASKQDWGDATEVYLKGAQNEQVSIDRKGGECIRINEPCFSAFLSGTPNATKRLLPGAENGLFSRFAHYGFEAPPVWRSHKPSPEFGARNTDFDQTAYSLDKLHQVLSNRPEPLFVGLSDEHWAAIDREFGGTLNALHQSGADRLLLASVKRAALLAARIACILSVLRLFEAGASIGTAKSIQPDDNDVESAIALASTYLAHGIELAQTLKEPARSKLTGSELRFLAALPDGEFSAKERNSVAKSLGLSDKTGQRYMAKLIASGLVEWPGYAKFLKCPVSNLSNLPKFSEPASMEPGHLDNLDTLTPGQNDFQR